MSRSRKIFAAGLGGYQEFLRSDAQQRGFVRNEAELQMVIDPVHYGIVCNKSAGSLRLA